MSKQVLTAFAGIAGIAVLATGCAKPTQAEFAEGAFPPVLSDTEYHEDPWSRPTCLSCHENEFEGATKLEHASLPPEAKQVRCRTCHVLVPGSSPK